MADVEKTAIMRVKVVLDEASVTAMQTRLSSVATTSVMGGGGAATMGGAPGTSMAGFMGMAGRYTPSAGGGSNGGGKMSGRKMIAPFVLGGALGGTPGAVGAALGGMPGAIAGIGIYQTINLIKKGVEAYAPLEDAIYRIGFNANLTQEEMDNLSQSLDGMTVKQSMQAKAMEYGVSTAVENAEAMAVLTTSGYDYAESLDIVDAAMMGALATGQDMSTIITGLIPTMQAFDIATEDTAKTVALLANAGRIGNVDIEDLSANMGTVAALMSQANSGLTETLGLLEQVSVSGITDPAQVFTGLRNVAKEFTNSGFLEQLESAFQTMNKLEGTNLSIFGDTGDIKSVLEILTDLAKGMEIGGGNVGMIVGKLFPDIRGRQSILALFGKDPSKAIEEVYVKMGKMYGLTEKDLKSLGYTSNATTQDQIANNIKHLKVLNDVDEAEKEINEQRIKDGEKLLDIQQEMVDNMYEQADSASEKISISLTRIQDALAAILTGGGEGARDLLREIADTLGDPEVVKAMSDALFEVTDALSGLATIATSEDGKAIIRLFEAMTGFMRFTLGTGEAVAGGIGIGKNILDMAITGDVNKNLEDMKPWGELGRAGLNNITGGLVGGIGGVDLEYKYGKFRVASDPIFKGTGKEYALLDKNTETINLTKKMVDSLANIEDAEKVLRLTINIDRDNNVIVSDADKSGYRTRIEVGSYGLGAANK